VGAACQCNPDLDNEGLTESRAWIDSLLTKSTLGATSLATLPSLSSML
jgi:hypothetical protein